MLTSVHGLAVVVVELDPEPGVDLLELSNGQLSDPLPVASQVRIPALQSGEQLLGLLGEADVSLRLPVRFDVDLVKPLDGVSSGQDVCQALAGIFEPCGQKAELSSPVAEKIDPGKTDSKL